MSRATATLREPHPHTQRTATPPHVGEPTVLRGLLVEFDEDHALLEAAAKVRDTGFRNWDTFSPYPVHGIERAMGVRPTRLPWLILACGLTGAATGLLLTWWTNSIQPRNFLEVPTFLQGYDFIVSGKPLWSMPAYVPVTFELTILFSAFGAVFGMIGLNGLPKLYQPLFRSRRFARVTSDRFFLYVDASDPRFREHETLRLLESLGGTAVEHVEDTLTKPRLPATFKIAAMILGCLALIPPAMAWRAWMAKSERPRIAIIQDMDNQERYKYQQAHPLFRDGREQRPIVPGTIARQDEKLMETDPHFFEGRIGDEWAETLPARVELSEALLRRGQARFAIYCAPCHGLDGYGEGAVHQRVMQNLMFSSKWVQPLSLHDEQPRSRPVGHIFNSITNGIRTMPPYGDQIAEPDRWAIVAYVRALQRSQSARPDDLNPQERSELEARE